MLYYLCGIISVEQTVDFFLLLETSTFGNNFQKTGTQNDIAKLIRFLHNMVNICIKPMTLSNIANYNLGYECLQQN